MAAHERLKNESTEDEKCHNLMSWLVCLLSVVYRQLVVNFDQTETDVDGVGDVCYNCPNIAISNQLDFDLMLFQSYVFISFT